MKILVTGADGQLGYDVCHALALQKIVYQGVDQKDFDITNEKDVKAYLKTYSPDAVIHCAAYTKVDLAEQESELCWAVNAEGADNVAQACQEIGAKVVYLSTDYVFDGQGERFYGTDAHPNPINVYGKSKLAGEQAVQGRLARFFIVRTSWMYGTHGQNFVKSILQKVDGQGKLQVVGDQFGSPTYTVDLANLLCDLVKTERYGVYHAVNEGVCSRAEFAREIIRCAGKKAEVMEITSLEYPQLAKRPCNSRMDTGELARAGFNRLPSWKDALLRYLREEGAGK